MKNRTIQMHHERLLKALIFIHNNIDEPLNLSKLANTSHYSLYHFHRLFAEMVGEPVKSYVQRLRLCKASVRLAYSKSSISTIAGKAGYTAVESFSRAFNYKFLHIGHTHFSSQAGLKHGI